MLSLYLFTPPQAQLEVLRALPVLRSGFSRLHASLALLDPFDSAHLDPFDRLVCSCCLSQLPYCHGVGAFYAALPSAWPSVDSASPNRLSLIRLRFCPNWLSPIRPRSWPSLPCWLDLPYTQVPSAVSFDYYPRLLQPT